MPSEFIAWLAGLCPSIQDSEWPETTKRNLIAESIRIHRTKGTVSAIERVLSALGVDAELTEWFENNGAPHTFQLLAWVNANLVPDADVILSPVLYRTLKQSIDDVKPIRSHYEFQVGAAFGEIWAWYVLLQAAALHALRPNLNLTLGLMFLRLRRCSDNGHDNHQNFHGHFMREIT